MKQSTGRGSDQFNLRFPEGMRDRIAQEADKSGRSMNAEIIARLNFTLNSNLSEKEQLNAQIDSYQLMIREYINQIMRLVTQKNSFVFLLEHNEVAHRQNLIFLDSLCHFIIEDPATPDHLKRFAAKSLESIQFHEDGDERTRVSDIANTEEEVQAIIRDVKENAEERNKDDPWANAFGNNGFITTVDTSQRDPTKIPDAPDTKTEKPTRKKNG